MFEKSESKSRDIESPPDYDLRDKGLVTALSIGAGLMVTTIGMMLLIADTFLGSLVSVVFSFQIIGIVLFGAIISLGRYVSLKGIRESENMLTAIGSILLVFGYGWFGGGILHPYDPSLYVPAIAIAGGVTTAITMIAATVVYSTDKNFEKFNMYSGYCFLGVMATGLVGTIFTPVILLSFGLALVGFLFSLVYEIWMTSNKNRPAYANGIGLYVAFAGVFVHVLQIALRFMSER